LDEDVHRLTKAQTLFLIKDANVLTMIAQSSFCHRLTTFSIATPRKLPKCERTPE